MALIAAWPVAGPAQVLDRVLAVVAGQVILASDVRAFEDLALFPIADPPPPLPVPPGRPDGGGAGRSGRPDGVEAGRPPDGGAAARPDDGVAGRPDATEAARPDGAVVGRPDAAGAARPDAAGAGRAVGDRARTALTRLIERRLVLDEVNRYRAPPPPPDRVDRALAGVRARFAGPEAFAARLAALGLTPDDLRQILRDNLRIAAYLDDQFDRPDAVSEAELRAYYDAYPALFAEAGRPAPFAAVQPAVEARLRAARRAAAVADWVAGLAARAAITRFDP